MSGVLCKNTFLAGVLGSQYLFEILETAKNGENVVKVDVSKNICD